MAGQLRLGRELPVGGHARPLPQGQHFPLGRTLWTAAHSSYWDRESASLKNMDRLINGQYDDLERPHHLDRTQLLMPELAPDLADQMNR